MNSRRAGDEFENRVYEALKSARSFRGILRSGGNTQWKRKPRYHSRDRERDIEFDISAELRIGPKTPPFLTLVVECKNYQHPVPVDDVEEFKAKLDQCFGKNVKGVLATNAALQVSALAYAKNNGICVLRLIDETTIEYVNYYVPGNVSAFIAEEQAEMLEAAEEALLDPDRSILQTSFGRYDTFGWVHGRYVTSLDDLVGDIIDAARRSRQRETQSD